MWQPGVLGAEGDEVYPPPSILYSTVKPDTAATLGKENEVPEQVLEVAEITGAEGKITTLTEALSKQPAGAVVFAALVPQALLRTYLAFTL